MALGGKGPCGNVPTNARTISNHCLPALALSVNDSASDLPASNSPAWLSGLALALVFAAAAATQVDLPLARWIAADNCPGSLAKLCGLAEVFSHGLGAAALVVAVSVLDPANRRRLPWVLALTFGSGLFSNVFKLLVSRIRPRHFDLQQTVSDTFTGWLPLLNAGSPGQSFPSSHAATSAGLTIALIWLYPRGRWLFPVYAGLAGCQRMIVGAHYLSDVLCGAAVGCACCAALISLRLKIGRRGNTRQLHERGAPLEQQVSRAA